MLFLSWSLLTHVKDSRFFLLFFNLVFNDANKCTRTICKRLWNLLHILYNDIDATRRYFQVLPLFRALCYFCSRLVGISPMKIHHVMLEVFESKVTTICLVMLYYNRQREGILQILRYWTVGILCHSIRCPPLWNTFTPASLVILRCYHSGVYEMSSWLRHSLSWGQARCIVIVSSVAIIQSFESTCFSQLLSVSFCFITPWLRAVQMRSRDCYSVYQNIWKSKIASRVWGEFVAHTDFYLRTVRGWSEHVL